MKEYATKDIVNIVGIAAPTVRKYSQALEKAGYQFTKNDRGFRIFTDKDIPIFEEMKTKSNDTGMNVEQIAEMLAKPQNDDANSTIQSESHVATLKENEENEPKISDLIRIEDERYETLLDEIDSLKQLIIKQQQYIDERLDQRDRKLMESLRESQEVKQQILQIAAAAEEEKKKGFFARLFGK